MMFLSILGKVVMLQLQKESLQDVNLTNLTYAFNIQACHKKLDCTGFRSQDKLNNLTLSFPSKKLKSIYFHVHD